MIKRLILLIGVFLFLAGCSEPNYTIVDLSFEGGIEKEDCPKIVEMYVGSEEGWRNIKECEKQIDSAQKHGFVISKIIDFKMKKE